jgi:hypothetical protein
MYWTTVLTPIFTQYPLCNIAYVIASSADTVNVFLLQISCVCSDYVQKYVATAAGFEPARQFANTFRVYHLNHSVKQPLNLPLRIRKSRKLSVNSMPYDTVTTKREFECSRVFLIKSKIMSRGRLFIFLKYRRRKLTYFRCFERMFWPEKP